MLDRILDKDTVEAMFRRKSLADAQDTPEDGTTSTTTALRRSLTAVDLVLYGVGSSVGAGIFVLVGLGAKIAGPGIAVSFLGCGMACTLTSFAYSEFASLIPASGSAFTYTYVAFGEFLAFLVGWNLILGYGFTASVTARAWADYMGNFLFNWTGQEWIQWMTEFPIFGTQVHYTCSPLSIVIIAGSTAVLLKGSKESSTFNNLMTITNLSILLLVVFSGLVSGSVSNENLTPFFPKGLPGVLQGAGLVFFAFIGFDMVASLSEEVVNPSRNMPIGIVGSLVASTLIYVVVSLSVVGMAKFEYLGETVPIVNALMVNACCSHFEQDEYIAHDQTSVCLKECQFYQKPLLATAAHLVSVGAILGLQAACFTSLMGQPRIFYKMASDGLWFPIFAKINPETQVMSHGIWITGIVAALFSCFVPLEALANLISLGTLMVFTFVNAGVILLRLGNVAEASFESTLLLQEKEQERKAFQRSYQGIVTMLFIYTGCLLVASIFLSNSTTKWPIVLFLAVAAVSGGNILYTPSSWVAKPSQLSSHNHTSFQCPCLPTVPLAGIFFNSFMMGSMSFSSWVLCLIWLTLGVSVYFTYGIHHSQLRLQHLQLPDSVPLIESDTSKNDDRRKRDYGGLK